MQTMCFAEKINKDWVKKDSKIIEKVLSFIDEGNYSNSGILNFMNKKLSKKNLGFNLMKSDSGMYGGYLSVYFSYISYENLPCELRISFYKDDFLRIKTNLPENQVQKINNIFKEENQSYVLAIKNNENYQKYLNEKQKQIGPIKELNLPSDYKNYYYSLISPFYEQTYGYIVGIVAEIPYGRFAMEKLLELKNKDIFINIVKSENPAGRMYGMEGLLSLDNSVESVNIINDVFDKLIKDEITFSSQDGCIVYDEKYQKVDLIER